MKKDLTPAEKLRGEYLQYCDDLISYTQTMRNFAMKPGNAWIARGELSKISALTGELEELLEKIKLADEAETL
jgi:hypothetical protein